MKGLSLRLLQVISGYPLLYLVPYMGGDTTLPIVPYSVQHTIPHALWSGRFRIWRELDPAARDFTSFNLQEPCTMESFRDKASIIDGRNRLDCGIKEATGVQDRQPL
jgi:hypothetical protein